MRKFIFATVLLLSAGTAFGQAPEKNAVISIHTLAIALNDGVTMDQYLDFMVDTFIPAYEKTFSCDAQLVKGLNRAIENRIGVLITFPSKEHWNTFWNDDGSSTETGQAKLEKFAPVMDKMNALGTTSSENVVDWVLQ